MTPRTVDPAGISTSFPRYRSATVVASNRCSTCAVADDSSFWSLTSSSWPTGITPLYVPSRRDVDVPCELDVVPWSFRLLVPEWVALRSAGGALLTPPLTPPDCDEPEPLLFVDQVPLSRDVSRELCVSRA